MHHVGPTDTFLVGVIFSVGEPSPKKRQFEHPMFLRHWQAFLENRIATVKTPTENAAVTPSNTTRAAQQKRMACKHRVRRWVERSVEAFQRYQAVRRVAFQGWPFQSCAFLGVKSRPDTFDVEQRRL
eukprot:scaffold265113_cov32-Tisochrysis_lutea.AAC.4